MRSKRYILPPEEDSPVFSLSPLPSNKAHQRKHHRRFTPLTLDRSHRLITYLCVWDYTMSRSFCTSLRVGFRVGLEASRDAFRDSRLGSQHTNRPRLWPTPRLTDRGFRPSIFSRLTSMKTAWRTRAIDSMTATDRADQWSKRRATKSSYSSLGLIGWARPYVPRSLNSLRDCQTHMDATDIVETKCRDVISKLDARRYPSELSVSHPLQPSLIS
jgi:hypothetical protein